MIDLVKRLRTMAAIGWNSIGDEAADTIESLRQQLADLKNIHNQTVSNGIAGFEAIKQQLAECQATNGRLRNDLLDFGKHKSFCAIHLTEKQNPMGGICNCGLQQLVTQNIDATALNELIAERIKTQKEYYESVFQDGANRIAELTAELQSTRLQMITDFGQYQEAHEKVKELTAEIERLKDCWSAEGAQVDTLRQQNAELTAQINNLKAQIAHLEYQYRP